VVAAKGLTSTPKPLDESGTTRHLVGVHGTSDRSEYENITPGVHGTSDRSEYDNTTTYILYIREGLVRSHIHIHIHGGSRAYNLEPVPPMTDNTLSNQIKSKHMQAASSFVYYLFLFDSNPVGTICYFPATFQPAAPNLLLLSFNSNRPP
jgi:hypothetical protein